jgi:hypothetical protein
MATDVAFVAESDVAMVPGLREASWPLAAHPSPSNRRFLESG